MTVRHGILIVCVAAAALAAGSARAQRVSYPTSRPAPDSTAAAAPDTSAVKAATPPVPTPVLPRGEFASLSKRRYILRHAYSFDHYLQFEPDVELARRGPIGADAMFSRFGIGRGRGVVMQDGVVLNDPQNDIAPIGHLPVSTFGVVSSADALSRALARTAAIEGVVQIDNVTPPADRPRTFIELSKGTENLRQRRVEFSSADGPVGIDLSYDEVLNDGYSFDATGAVGINTPGYGGATSRNVGARVRGTRGDDGSYAISFRQFTSTFNGDLVSARREQRRDGHLATATARYGRVGVRLFERGYDFAYPDSHTVDQTTGAGATVTLARSEHALIVLDAGFEDIASTQHVGGAVSSPSLSKSTANIDMTAALPAGAVARAWLCGADYHGLVSQWGGGLAAARDWGHGWVGVEARRSYRMPNLGELFVPAHVTGSKTLSGNKYLDAEYAWEAGSRAGVRVGPLDNEVRWASIRVVDPVALRVRDVGGAPFYLPMNTGGALLHVFEDRLRFQTTWRGVEMNAHVAGVLTSGDRVGYFAAASERRLVAGARIGGAMFEATSALYAGVEFVHSGERTGFDGTLLPAYDVLNLSLDGRLLDANMYLALFNVTDEAYRTDGNYLMTPRTFVYGIAWTLWE